MKSTRFTKLTVSVLYEKSLVSPRFLLFLILLPCLTGSFLALAVGLMGLLETGGMLAFEGDILVGIVVGMGLNWAIKSEFSRAGQ